MTSLDESSNELEAALLAEIQSSFADLESWSQQFAKFDRPATGSSLAEDDEIWPWDPLSGLAHQSMLASLDHLKLAGLAIWHGQLFPTALFSALRGAIVGAGQAVWLLAPALREERQQRALQVTLESNRRHMQYLETLVGTSGLDVRRLAMSHDQIATLGRHQLRAQSLRTNKDKFILTTALEWSFDHAFANPRMQQQARLLWKSTSGDAHALGWAMMTRASSWAAEPDDPFALVKISGSLTSTAQPYLCAYLLLKEAVRLYDLGRASNIAPGPDSKEGVASASPEACGNDSPRPRDQQR